MFGGFLGALAEAVAVTGVIFPEVAGAFDAEGVAGLAVFVPATGSSFSPEQAPRLKITHRLKATKKIRAKATLQIPGKSGRGLLRYGIHPTPPGLCKA